MIKHWNDKCFCRDTHTLTLCLLPTLNFKNEVLFLFSTFFRSNIGVELNSWESWDNLFHVYTDIFEYIIIIKMVSIPFCIFCVMCETTQFSNKDFCSHCLEFLLHASLGFACLKVFCFYLNRRHLSYLKKSLFTTFLPLSIDVQPVSAPPPLVSCRKKGLTHDNWAPGLCTNHMTERVLSTNRGTATAGLCDVTPRGDFFVQPSVLLVWLITLPQLHTHSLLFLHADNKSSTANPHFSPGVLMVLVMGGMRQNMFVWEPQFDLNQI